MGIENEFSHRRKIERFGGKETVGSVLWLEHVQGIKYKSEDGIERLLTSKDLIADEDRAKNSPFFQLTIAMKEDASMITHETWLKDFVLRMLPIKITGDKNQPPLIFNTELKIFTVPQELTVNPGVIEQTSEIINIENGEVKRELSKEQAITFALRLIPEQGYVNEFGYYPGGLDDDYGIAALEVTPDLIRMELHHRIYAEIYRKTPSKLLPPLIAPHQF